MQLRQIMKDAKSGTQYGVPQLARMLDLHPVSMNRLIATGVGPKYRKEGTRYFIAAGDVLDWLEHCRPARIGFNAARDAA